MRGSISGVKSRYRELGLSEAEVNALPASELASRLNAASHRLLQAGAHYVIPEVAHLPAIITQINERLARGERP
jgi:phosphonoacetaldehyde hydrolase